MNSRSYARRFCHTLRSAVALVIISTTLVATTAVDTTLAHEADGHPARIHEGSCDAIGRVTDQLTGVGAEVSVEGTPIPTPEVVGSEAAFPIEVSTTALEATVSDLIDTPHAIVVYESDEAMDTALVCGTVGGAMMMQMPGMPRPGDELVIWLAPEGDADYTGVALLRSEVGGTSTVSIFLAEGLAAEAAATDGHEHNATSEASPTD